MSHFSNALQAILEKNRLTQTAVCERTKISQGQISRYISGENNPPRDALEKLLNLFEKRDRTNLLLAYLTDATPRSARSLVKISPVAGGADPGSPIPQTLRGALRFLEKAARENPNVASALINLRKLLEQ